MHTSAAEGGLHEIFNFLLAKIRAVQPESLGDTDIKILLIKIKSTASNVSLRGLKIQVELVLPDRLSFPEYVYPILSRSHFTNFNARESRRRHWLS